MDVIFENFDFTHIQTMIIWLCFTYGLVVFAMLVDLVAGVRKAVQLGIARTSTGYKKTCTKANKYFSPMIRLTFIDLLASAFIGIPVFSMLWAAWCLFCEYTSVTEKALTKQELRDAEQTMKVIIKNKDDLAEVLVNALHSMSEQDLQKLRNQQSAESE